jgi:hypothetical protein
METSLESIPESEGSAMKEYLTGYVYWHQVRFRLAGMFGVQAAQRSRDSIWPCQVIDLLHTLVVFCLSWAPNASGDVIVGVLRKSPARRSLLPTQ